MPRTCGSASVNWLEKSDEIIYATERDGWRHLYLIDAKTGAVKNPITQGSYVVRGIDRIDEDARQVWFHAGGKNPDQDPYFVHYYRVGFDGRDLVALTEGDGSHSLQYSPDRRFLIDTYSRVDRPPVHELRRASDGKLVCKLEEADISGAAGHGLAAARGFRRQGTRRQDRHLGHHLPAQELRSQPEIPGHRADLRRPAGLVRSQDLQPGAAGSRRSPTWASSSSRSTAWAPPTGRRRFTTSAGTTSRTPASPTGSSGTRPSPRKYPWYDLDRVGIYGTSAGGQNATAGVLFHPEFYKVAASACGCHDNRMDKASWNEQWMGYPVGPWYSASSNIDNAHRLQGKLLLIVGEMDTNVPPESTMRLVDALIKAGKDFELLVVPNANHGMGGAYGQRRMNDFFVRHLLGTGPASASGRPARDVAATHADGVASSAPILGSEPSHGSPARSTWATSPTTAASCAVLIERYSVDRNSLQSSSPPSASPARDEQRARLHHASGCNKLEKLEFDRLTQDGKVDYLLFKNYLVPPASSARPAVEGAVAGGSPGAVRAEDPRSRCCAAGSEIDGMVEGGRLARQPHQGDQRSPADLERDSGSKDKVKREAANRALASVDDLREHAPRLVRLL